MISPFSSRSFCPASGNEWAWKTTELVIPDGVSAIYFRMKGYGTLSLAAVKFEGAVPGTV